MSLPDARYPTPDAAVQFMEELETRLARVAGVEGVATTVSIPFGTVSLAGGFRRMDRPAPEPGETPESVYHAFDAEAFSVLGVRVARGRAFEPGDRWGAEPVALINETAARLYFPDEDPVGKEIDVFISVGYPEDAPRRIVGVVGDFRTSLSEGETARLIVPYAQTGASFPHVAMRYSGVTAASVLTEAREVLQALDPELPMSAALTLEEMVAQQTAGSRFYLLLLGLFAGMAVVLAAVGIYGLVAYLVARRTSEIAMRLALGAGIDRVIRMVVWQGVRPALIGIVVGLAGAFALRRIVSTMLYGVEPTDPLTIAATATVLLAVVAAATALPARRASRIPPAEALRGER